MRPLAALALAVGALVGCSSETDEAVQLVRDACGTAQPSAPGQSDELKPGEAAEIASDYDEAATLVARAARLDPAWSELADAYSTLADAWSYGASLSQPLTEQQRTEASRLLTTGRPAEAEVRAGCRRATA